MNTDQGNFRRLNNITGWIMFVFASIVYLLTLEPTVSFWDCGEFILAAFKLQVGHPPGAPLFLMLGRVATLFAGGNLSKVALMVNIFSAIESGLAIMFLYWTISHLVRKVYVRNGEMEARHIVPVIASGILGALTYTFSDTFWFSAVEGELYALSSLITGLVFWAMLKWEDEADEPDSGRWIILISYIMGLGLGVHRLNLLVIPILIFVYYFRKYEVTTRGMLKTLVISVGILWLMVFVLIPGVPEVAGWFELLFINILGMPYNTGLLVFLIVIFGGLAYGIYLSLQKRKVILNYILTSLLVIMIGYSSYAMIMIRSSARPPMNQNNPSDVFSLSYYINMKQYGSSPKFFGNYYSAPVVGVHKVVAGYNKVKGKYIPYYHPEYEYSSQFETVFPRMYSPDPEHESAYKYWGRVVGKRYAVGDSKDPVVCPTFGENLIYFFRYQVGFMYLRYFMWNFAGRQNDIEGNGNPVHGNWISGIKFIDEARLGNLDKLPADLKNNPGHNTYYFLPLIVGLLGMFWQYNRERNGFWLVLAFFILTGLAIILYLNQYPNQPRERDYAYAGSFYAFAIWIGMGFMLIYEKLEEYLGNKLSAIITFVVLMVSVPALMGAQNWDDHSRAGRYTARDIGENYLKSCAPNSILFTYGDNDSFPVWYAQDVENCRTDVRVANLSYIQAGWYIDMMRQKAYGSEPMPLTLSPDKYMDGTREQLPVNNRVEKPVNIREVVQFASQDDRKYMVDISGRGDYMNYIPANKLEIDVDSADVLANGTVRPYYRNRILSPLIWNYSEGDVFKGDLAIMDLLATNNWKRPVYFSTTVPNDQYKGLEKFFVQEGLSYRIVPIKIDQPEKGEFGMVDAETMYDNMMHKFTWGNAADTKVYLDENNRRMFSNFRRLFATLGKSLVMTGDTARAAEVVHKALGIVPPEKMPNDFFSIGLGEVLILAGRKDEGIRLMTDIHNYAKEYLEYALTIRSDQRFGLDYPIGINMQAMLDIYNLSVKMKLDSLTALVEPDINNYYSKLYSTK
jgi:hypothetical protein